MPNQDEAREEAWRAFTDEYTRWAARGIDEPIEFDYAWDARGRYDEQRIAELVEAAQEAHDFATPTWNADNVLIHPCLVCTGETSHILGCWVETLGLALGQSEEVKP